MIFVTKQGEKMIVVHRPNETTAEDFEHIVIKNLIEENDVLRIGD